MIRPGTLPWFAAHEARLAWPGSKGAKSKEEAKGLVLVTETEIFGRQRTRRPVLNRRATAQRASLAACVPWPRRPAACAPSNNNKASAPTFSGDATPASRTRPNMRSLHQAR